MSGLGDPGAIPMMLNISYLQQRQDPRYRLGVGSTSPGHPVCEWLYSYCTRGFGGKLLGNRVGFFHNEKRGLNVA